MNTATLWYVRDQEGDLDLLVKAITAEEVLPLWRTHYDKDPDELPTYIGPVELGDMAPGVIDWTAVLESPRTVHYKELQ